MAKKMGAYNLYTRTRSMRWKWMLNTTARNFRINDKPRYAFYTHPGLNYDATDSYGNPKLGSLMDLTNDAGSFAMYQPYTKDGVTIDLVHWQKMMVGRTLYIAADEYSMSRAMYNNSLSKWPLDYKLSLGGIGNTSLHLLHELFIPGIDEPILTRHSKFITVDDETRKPAPHPDWIINSLRGCDAGVPDFRVARLKRPKKTFIRRLVTGWSDTDVNNHIGNASFIQWGLDAVHLALILRSRDRAPSEDKSGHKVSCKDMRGMPESNPSYGHAGDPDAIQWMPLDAMKYGVKSLRICYLKEIVEGEMIDTHIWQAEGESLGIKCSVEKMDGTPASQFVLEFFSPRSHL